jgi:hypothetical protein
VTACPPVATACPNAVTVCPGQATACPPTTTQCTNAVTVCPALATVCPVVATQCPPLVTACVQPAPGQTCITTLSVSSATRAAIAAERICVAIDVECPLQMVQVARN